ncbi:MAG: transposase [Candidatus Curtissbacteria bacterium]
MRNIKIAPGEYYHIYNRGVNKQKIFHDKTDCIRFIFLILYFQSPVTFPQIGRAVKYFVKHSVFDTNAENIPKIIKSRFVELIMFCLMPNHFHLVLKEVEEGGIARYMQRVLNSYSKYYNAKYQKSGHLFQGPYCAVHIKDDRQLMYLSAYIHKNSRELSEWKNREDLYPWSSYQDYIEENRWGDLLMSSIVIDRFKDKKEYLQFVQSSGAKEYENELEFGFI